MRYCSSGFPPVVHSLLQVMSTSDQVLVVRTWSGCGAPSLLQFARRKHRTQVIEFHFFRSRCRPVTASVVPIRSWWTPRHQFHRAVAHSSRQRNLGGVLPEARVTTGLIFQGGPRRRICSFACLLSLGLGSSQLHSASCCQPAWRQTAAAVPPWRLGGISRGLLRLSVHSRVSESDARCRSGVRRAPKRISDSKAQMWAEVMTRLTPRQPD